MVGVETALVMLFLLGVALGIIIGAFVGWYLHRLRGQVLFNSRLKMTWITVRDVPTVWVPLKEPGPSIDLGYDMKMGDLIGIQIWDDVRNRDYGNRKASQAVWPKNPR